MYMLITTVCGCSVLVWRMGLFYEEAEDNVHAAEAEPIPVPSQSDTITFIYYVFSSVTDSSFVLF